MNPFTYSARSLVRARGFSSASVTTIALAVAASCAVFGLVNAVLLRPLPYPNSDRLVSLWHTMPGLDIPIAKQAPGTYKMYKESARSIEQMGVYVALAATLTYPRRNLPPERVRLAWTTASIFSVLGARPLLGRLLTDADATHGAPPVAMISERLWRTHFGGDPRLIGQNLDIDGEARQIVGVMPESFAFPQATTPVWAPLDLSDQRYVGGFGFDGIGRLRPGVTREAAQRELQQILTRLPQRFPELRPGVSTEVGMRQTRLAPIVHWLRDDVIAGFDRVLWLIAATVAILALVAFSNIASLLLVRVEARQREYAIRSALGASTLSMWRNLMTEAALIAVCGGVIGLAVASAGLQLLVHAQPLGMPRLNEVHVDAALLFAGVALIFAFTLVSASIGASRIRSGNGINVLRDGGRAGTVGGAAHRMRAAFVAVEVALSLVLLAGSGVLARSVLRLRAVQPGFDPTNTFTFWTFLPEGRYKRPTDAARFYREALDRMRRLPGVIAVGATAKLPLEVEGFPYRILIWGDKGAITTDVLPPAVQATSTSAGYFKAMRIPFIAGRTYDEASVRRGALEAVASRGFVQQIWHDPTGRSGLGKRVAAAAGGPWFTIVGVVGDERDSTLTQPPVSEVYFPEEPISDNPPDGARTTGRDMAFVVRTRGPAPGLQQLLRGELHAMDPNLPFYRPATMEQIVADARAGTTFALMLLAVGALTTLLLGAVGLYGVIAYVVSLRTREISIRIALGLVPSAAAHLILRQGGAIIGVGAAAGLAAFLVFSKLLTTLAFEVRPVDLTTLVVALAGVVGIATAATWIPARRASRIDPARALSGD